MMCTRTLQVRLIRVGHLDRAEVVAARVVLEAVTTLGGAQISLALFLPNGIRPERYVVRALDPATMHEQQLPLGLANYDPIRWRELLLMHGGKIERSYHVALGPNPVGRKEREGDLRTPEGRYRLERNPRSGYFLSIKVSYPNRGDLERARAHHWDPGGSIMIHGRPNVLKHEPEYYEKHDWTDGCIAVSNADMAEIWRLTPDGAPIDILP